MLHDLFDYMRQSQSNLIFKNSKKLVIKTSARAMTVE